MEFVQKSDIIEIMRKLAKLQEDINFLKGRIVDEDSIMTEEDYESILESRKEKKEGKLISEKNKDSS